MFISPYLTQDATSARIQSMRLRIAKEADNGVWPQGSDYFKLPLRERAAINRVLFGADKSLHQGSYQHPILCADQP